MCRCPQSFAAKAVHQTCIACIRRVEEWREGLYASVSGSVPLIMVCVGVFYIVLWPLSTSWSINWFVACHVLGEVRQTQGIPSVEIYCKHRTELLAVCQSHLSDLDSVTIVPFFVLKINPRDDEQHSVVSSIQGSPQMPTVGYQMRRIELSSDPPHLTLLLLFLFSDGIRI